MAIKKNMLFTSHTNLDDLTGDTFADSGLVVDSRNIDQMLSVPIDLDIFCISSAAKSIYLRLLRIAQGAEIMEVSTPELHCLRADAPHAGQELLDKKLRDGMLELVWFGLICLDVGDDNRTISYLIQPLIKWRYDRSQMLYPYRSSNILGTVDADTERTESLESNSSPAKTSPVLDQATTFVGKNGYTHPGVIQQQKTKLLSENLAWSKRWTFDPRNQEFAPVVHDFLVEYLYSQKKAEFTNKAHARNYLQRPGYWEVAKDIYEEYLQHQEDKKANVGIQESISTAPIEDEYLKKRSQEKQQNFQINFQTFSELLKEHQGSDRFEAFTIIEGWVDKNQDKVRIAENSGVFSLELVSLLPDKE